jgi:RNA methyltransferase, TrmH family
VHPNRVTSVASDRVTAVRALHARRGRRKAGRFIVEGPQAVRSAIAAGVLVHDLFVDEDAGGAFSDEVAAVHAVGGRVTLVTEAVMTALSETRQPQGVLGVCDLLPEGGLDALMASSGPVVLLDELTDPGNVGTVIRTADAVGAAGVVLTPGCADIHNGKVVRSTAGSLFHLPVLAGHAVDATAAAAHRTGRTVVAASGDADVDLFAAVRSGAVDDRTCWVIGSEAHGVGAEARAAADLVVRIPMSGRAESLNAAVAAAAVLYVTAYGAVSVLGPRSPG